MDIEIENKAYAVASQLASWIETVEFQTQIEDTLNVIEHFEIIFDDIDSETLDEFSALLIKYGCRGFCWRSAISYFHHNYIKSGRCIPSLIHNIFQFIENGGFDMGRPSLSDQVRKDSIHSTCLDVEDSEFIKSYANNMGISVSDAIRQAVIYLKVKVSPKV